MMKRKLLILILTIIIICVAAPINALADDDDFEVEYDFLPDTVGYLGADIELMLDITNTGPTNITWIDVVVNTQSAFSQRWTGTIAPGASDTLSFHIPFAQDDLNKEKILQVSMNNNISTNPDGIYMDRFEIEGINIFDISCTVTPEQTVYYPGDTVTVTSTFTNNMPRGTALNMRTSTYFTKGTTIIGGDSTNHGNVLPGDTISNSQTYTFTEEDTGETIYATYYADFDLMGKHYVLNEDIHSFNIGTPAADIAFTAHLSADRTEIDAGDTVTFTVQVENTGDDDIGVFEIRNTDGELEVETEPLPAGDAGTVEVSAQINASTDVSYVVVGRTGDDSESLETNSVHITVREGAAPTETVAASPTPAVTPDDVPDVTPFPLKTDAAAGTTDDITPEADDNANTADASPTLLLFILGGIGLLILAAIITLIVVLSKNKKDPKNAPKNVPKNDNKGDRNSL